MNNKPTHGGKREGAGRKPKYGAEASVKASVRLSPANYRWLVMQPGNLSEAINKLLDKLRVS